MNEFFEELRTCSDRIQMGVLVMVSIIFILSIAVLVESFYISGEKIRMQNYVEEYIDGNS